MPTQIESLADPNPEAGFPRSLPVMLIDGAALLPGAMLPLHIFEPRYCQLLEDTLKEGRSLCIGTPLSTADSDKEVPEIPKIHQHSTRGIVRSAVTGDDGTYQIILQGMETVKLVEWNNSGTRLYHVATFELANPKIAVPLTVKSLSSEIIESLKETPLSGDREAWESHLDSLEDCPEALSEFAAAPLLNSSDEQLRFLSADSIDARLEIIRAALFAPAE